MANYDHYTELAIRSIFLGARIHDAAVLCGKSDRLMRQEFLAFSEKKNPVKYEELSVEAANDGYSTVPSAYFQGCVLDFIPLKDIHPSFMYASLEEMAAVYDYLERSFSFATANLSIQRARRDAWRGIVELTKSTH